MASNVIFKVGTSTQFKAIQEKDRNTLYWLTDTQELYKGDALYGVGTVATAEKAGLLSAVDKQALDTLVQQGGANVPEYAMELKEESEEGYAAVYRLKRSLNGEDTYPGVEIKIPKDKVLKSGTVETVTVEGVPYADAHVGDHYLDLVLNTDGAEHIYIPAEGIVSPCKPGTGITIEDGVVSVKLDEENANGLQATEAGLGLKPVTAETPGAMMAEDKRALDAVPVVYNKARYEVSSLLAGARVSIRGNEIRVMFAEDTQWVHQNGGGDKNNYYFSVKLFAPDDERVTGFREDGSDGTKPISDPKIYHFEAADFGGVDQYGRRYSIIWLPAATYDEESSEWTYFGDQSSDGKYMGWYHTIEWCDEEGNVYDSETVRINLTNERCHNCVKPFYVGDGSSLVWSDM